MPVVSTLEPHLDFQFLNNLPVFLYLAEKHILKSRQDAERQQEQAQPIRQIGTVQNYLTTSRRNTLELTSD